MNYTSSCHLQAVSLITQCCRGWRRSFLLSVLKVSAHYFLSLCISFSKQKSGNESAFVKKKNTHWVNIEDSSNILSANILVPLRFRIFFLPQAAPARLIRLICNFISSNFQAFFCLFVYKQGHGVGNMDRISRSIQFYTEISIYIVI